MNTVFKTLFRVYPNILSSLENKFEPNLIKTSLYYTSSKRYIFNTSNKEKNINKTTWNESEAIDSAKLQNKIEEHEKTIQLLSTELDEANNRIRETQDKLLRSLADAENSRERHQKEIQSTRQYAITKFAQVVLEVADNLELAVKHCDEGAQLQTIIEGVEMTHNSFVNNMKNFGITSFDSMNTMFNPTLHEAMFDIPGKSDTPKGTILQVIKKGYKINDRILRPAKVGTAS